MSDRRGSSASGKRRRDHRDRGRDSRSTRRRRHGDGRPPAPQQPEIDLKKLMKGSTQEETQQLEENRRKLRVESEFICNLVFRNKLPDVPCDPKFNVYPFPKDRLTKFDATSLDTNHQAPLYMDTDLGVPIKIMQALRDVGSKRVDTENQAELSEVDKRLLVAYSNQDRSFMQRPKGLKGRKTAAHYSERHKTITAKPVVAGADVDAEVKKCQSIIDRVIHEVIGDRSDIAVVEKTFDDAKKCAPETLRHPKNPNLRATKIVPLLPAEHDVHLLPMPQEYRIPPQHADSHMFLVDRGYHARDSHGLHVEIPANMDPVMLMVPVTDSQYIYESSLGIEKNDADSQTQTGQNSDLVIFETAGGFRYLRPRREFSAKTLPKRFNGRMLLDVTTADTVPSLPPPPPPPPAHGASLS